MSAIADSTTRGHSGPDIDDTAGSSRGDHVFARTPNKLTDLYDAASIKFTLDELTAQILTDSGYKEDHRLHDARMALQFVCSVAGIFSHFHKYLGVKIPFPDNKPLVATCVAIWAVAFAANYIIGTFFEKDVAVRTYPGSSGSLIHVASKLDPAGTGDWTLELRRPAAHGSAASARPAGKVERKCTVGAFFHESGECAEDAYGAWVKEALAELEGKQEGGKEGKGGKENKKKK